MYGKVVVGCVVQDWRWNQYFKYDGGGGGGDLLIGYMNISEIVRNC